MTLKYEITGIQHSHREGLYRIRALRGILKYNVKAGDLGGYIESEWNLSQEGDCWIGDDATVHGSGQVYNNAWVFENAQVFSNRFGNSSMPDVTHVFGNAFVYGKARVFENAHIYGNAKVHDQAMVFGNAHIYDNAQVYKKPRIFGNVHIFGNAQVLGDAWVSDDVEIYDFMQVSEWVSINSNKQLYYADGVTAFLLGKTIAINCSASDSDIEQHKMLARLKLS